MQGVSALSVFQTSQSYRCFKTHLSFSQCQYSRTSTGRAPVYSWSSWSSSSNRTSRSACRSIGRYISRIFIAHRHRLNRRLIRGGSPPDSSIREGWGRGTGNGERETGNGERGLRMGNGNREQRTGNRDGERGTEKEPTVSG